MALKLIYLMGAKLLSWMLHVRSDTDTCGVPELGRGA